MWAESAADESPALREKLAGAEMIVFRYCPSVLTGITFWTFVIPA